MVMPTSKNLPFYLSIMVMPTFHIIFVIILHLRYVILSAYIHTQRAIKKHSLHPVMCLYRVSQKSGKLDSRYIDIRKYSKV